MDFSRPVAAEQLDALLARIDKPGRYTGGELNSVVKENVRARAALCFADMYEVAESHIGLKILYDIVNARPDFAAERVYALWPDLDALAREHDVPLWSLETRRPLALFDLVGFSLQYELCYPTLLRMLQHGGVTLRSAQRAVGEPFVIGGGAGAFNPEPIAPFFDAFFLGDAEEGILDMLEVIATGRERHASRAEILGELARIEGVYVPSHFEISYDGVAVAAIVAKPGTPAAASRSKHGTPRVVRRTLADLDTAPYPTRTIVPNVEPVHDRVAIEIQRGCSQACRFCQAGMITRPTRQRRPETVLDLAQRSLESSGKDEVGLLSLSAGDYGPINEVLGEFFKRYKDQRIGVSLPSMRTESMTPELAEQVATVRKTGFTLAPEAGSERMRRVINKTNREEDLMNAVRATVQAGWRHLKFYFMIGLPTETDDDVDAIAHVAERARAEGRRIRPDVDVTVSVSTFVPKPHTSFQWERQIDLETTRAKQHRLRDRLKPQRIAFRYHTPEQSWLEGVLSRGDRRLAEAMLLAAERGAHLDAWSEFYDHRLWVEALRDGLAPYGLAPDDYLRERGGGEVLPWDHLDAGILKKFLLRDRKKAYQAATIEDCAFADHCYACGGCDLGDPYKRKGPDGQRPVQLQPLVHQHITEEIEPAADIAARSRPVAQPGSKARSKLRFRFAKLGRGVHISHLDMMAHILRAIRLAKLPVIYSEGFNPRPRVGFSPACPTGIESEAEYFEVECWGFPPGRKYAERLRHSLPDGLLVLDVEELDSTAPGINNLLVGTTYRVTPPTQIAASMLRAAVEAFKASDPVVVRVLRKRRPRRVDARVCVTDLEVVGGTLQISIGFNGGGGTLKIGEAVAAVLGPAALPNCKIYKQRIVLADAPATPEAVAAPAVSEGPVLDLTGLSKRRNVARRRGTRRESMVVPYAE